LGFTVTACSTSPIALIDAIVAATELALPVAGVSPEAVTYVDNTLNTTDSLLAGGINGPNIATAIASYDSDLAPLIPDPKVAAIIKGVSTAVSAFTKEYSGVTVTSSLPHGAFAAFPTGKTVRIKLSSKDLAKIDRIRARIIAARTKLHKP